MSKARNQAFEDNKGKGEAYPFTSSESDEAIHPAPTFILNDPDQLGREKCLQMLRAKLGEDMPSEASIAYNPYGSNNHEFLAESYKARIQSATKAIAFLFQAYGKPLNQEALTHPLKEILSELSLMETLDGQQATLTKYLLALQHIVKINFGCDSKTAKEMLADADEYVTLSEPRPVIATITTHRFTVKDEDRTINFLQLEKPLSPWTEERIEQLRQMNKGKLQGSPEEIKWLVNLRDNFPIKFKLFTYWIQSNQHDFNTLSISSRDRTLPGAANFSRVDRRIIFDDNTFQDIASRFRSSMGSSRDLLNEETKLGLQNEITRENYDHIIDAGLKTLPLIFPDVEPVVLMQTLLTPLGVGTLLSPDEGLLSYKNNALDARQKSAGSMMKLVITNHPLNTENKPAPIAYVATTLTGSKSVREAGRPEDSILQLVSLLNRQYRGNEEMAKVIKGLTTDVESIFVGRQPDEINYTDPRQMELHLASLESIMARLLNGVDYGSCISGKDRKGVQLLYVDAMELYRSMYGIYPKYYASEEDRNNFVAIFAKLFLSRHQHLCAGLNAPGANGLKGLTDYLPTDIQAAIIKMSGNAKILAETKKLAFNNELDKIIGKHPLDEATQLKLNDAFHPEKSDEESVPLMKEVSESEHFADKEEADEQAFQVETFVDREELGDDWSMPEMSLNANLADDVRVGQLSEILMQTSWDKPETHEGVKDMRVQLENYDPQFAHRTLEKIAEIAEERLSVLKRLPTRDANINQLYRVILFICRGKNKTEADAELKQLHWNLCRPLSEHPLLMQIKQDVEDKKWGADQSLFGRLFTSAENRLPDGMREMRALLNNKNKSSEEILKEILMIAKEKSDNPISKRKKEVQLFYDQLTDLGEALKKLSPLDRDYGQKQMALLQEYNGMVPPKQTATFARKS